MIEIIKSCNELISQIESYLNISYIEFEEIEKYFEKNTLEYKISNDISIPEYLEQVYIIDECKPLIDYKSNNIESILNRVKSLEPLYSYIQENSKENVKITKCIDRIFSKLNKISLSDDTPKEEVSEVITGKISKVVQNIINDVLSISITNYNKSKREKLLNEAFYFELIEKIKEYLKSINVYTYQCEKNAKFTDENVMDYFTDKSYPITTSDTTLDGTISEIIYPPHIIKYFNEYGEMEYQIIEGKCKYYNVLD